MQGLSAALDITRKLFPPAGKINKGGLQVSGILGGF